MHIQYCKSTYDKRVASGPSILNKSENATPKLFAIYIQNNANQEYNDSVYLNVQILGNA